MLYLSNESVLLKPMKKVMISELNKIMNSDRKFFCYCYGHNDIEMKI